jgi:hypothetical protein
LKKFPVCSTSQYKNNAGYCGDDNQGSSDVNKRNVVKNSGASIEPNNTTLGISKKHSRILAMVMWYLPVFNHLRCLFSNPKDAELMRWWDSKISTRRVTESSDIS